MIYGGRSHQDFDWRSWQPDEAALKDLLRAGGYYNANDPDLSAFKAGGGKLIMWQGKPTTPADPICCSIIISACVMPWGFAGTDPFMRVYMLPAAYHCTGGYIAYQHDMLGPVVNWVERGTSPGAVVGTAALADGAIAPPPGLSLSGAGAIWGGGISTRRTVSCGRQRRACPTIISIGWGGHHRRQTAGGLILFRPIE
jgi:feruloyl esterase